LEDFNEFDLKRWNPSGPCSKIRLKPDALPNTDRATGFYARQDQLWLRSRPPKRRQPPGNLLQDSETSLQSTEVQTSPSNQSTPSFSRQIQAYNQTVQRVVQLPDNSRSKGCQAGNAYIHEYESSHLLSSRSQEVDNFLQLEMLLGPEEEEEDGLFGDKGIVRGLPEEEEDPDWTYMDVDLVPYGRSRSFLNGDFGSDTDDDLDTDSEEGNFLVSLLCTSVTFIHRYTNYQGFNQMSDRYNPFLVIAESRQWRKSSRIPLILITYHKVQQEFNRCLIIHFPYHITIRTNLANGLISLEIFLFLLKVDGYQTSKNAEVLKFPWDCK
jgi:hypothetical protein